MIADDPRDVALVESLAFFVPMWRDEIRDLTDEQRVARAKRCSSIVGSLGDALQFGSRQAGRVTEVFNALAEGLACAAYQPGGITFAGRHWCTDHRLCLDAASAAVDCDLQWPTEPPERTVENAVLGPGARGLL